MLFRFSDLMLRPAYLMAGRYLERTARDSFRGPPLCRQLSQWPLTCPKKRQGFLWAGLRIFVFLTALLIARFPNSFAVQMQALLYRDVQVYFESGLRSVAEEVARIYPGIRNELQTTLGWRLEMRPSVLLISKRSRFQNMAESPLTVAFAVPDKAMIVIDHSRVTLRPFSLETVLKHELCHLFLHQHVESRNLPRWLDEGICQWVSGGISDIIMYQKRSLLNRAILSRNYIPLTALGKRFPRKADMLSLAYEESKSFVTFLVGKYGMDRVLVLLERLRSGMETNAAFRETFSSSISTLENEWHDSLRKRTTWFVYLSYHLYEILFALMAMVTIYASFRLIQKKRAYRDEEPHEDEWMP